MPKDLRTQPLLKLNIRTRIDPPRTSSVYSITTKNSKGNFDILPFHSNFVTMISGDIIVDKELPTEKTIKMEKGILTVVSNTVDVYVGV